MSRRATPAAQGRRLVLVTRPQADADATLATLARMGFAGIAAPMQQVVRLAPKPLPGAAAILLTSRNGVRALGRPAASLRALPAFCVGDATAAEARAAGFADVRSAGADAVALARLVRTSRRPEDGPLLLATASGAGLKLAGLLRKAGFRVLRRTVYRMQDTRLLAGAARAALAGGEVGWVLFHAASAARAFVALLEAAGLAETVRDVAAVAISGAAAKPLGILPWRKTSWPALPNEAAMLDLLPGRRTSRRR